MPPELRPSHLHSKHFTNCAILPVPMSYILRGVMDVSILLLLFKSLSWALTGRNNRDLGLLRKDILPKPK